MDPERRNNRWDKREFFQTGIGDIDYAMHTIRAIEFPLRQGRALDFGCGLGRLTQGLACYFDEAHGVDIAPSMIEQARRYNPYGDRCQFHVNQSNDLRLFPDNHFDFVFSIIVLQHIRPDYVKNYIAEFMRVLAPGGLLLFQQPSHYSRKELSGNHEELLLKIRRKSKLWLRKATRKAIAKLTGREYVPYALSGHCQPKHEPRSPHFDWQDATPPVDSSAPTKVSADGTIIRIDAPRTEHHPIKRREILAHLRRLKGRVIDIRQRGECAPHWASYRYSVTK